MRFPGGGPLSRGAIPISLSGGGDLQPAEFETFIEGGEIRPQTGDTSPNTIGRGQRDSLDGGYSRGPRTITIHHKLAGATVTAIDDNMKLVKALYEPRWGEQAFTFTLDGEEVTARVRLLKCVPNGGIHSRYLTGTWELRSSRYLSTTPTAVTPTSETALPAVLSATNAGSVASPDPIYTLTPGTQMAAADGQRYRVPMTLIPQAPRGGRHPVDITGGGWAHNAEVTATRSHTTGRDVEVVVGGASIPRWDGPGTAAFDQAGTRIWCTLDLPARRRWTINGALTNVATTVVVEEELLEMPPLPALIVLSQVEPVLVTAYDVASRSMTITRGQRGVTATTHLDGAVAELGVAVDLLYGWTSRPAPEQDDRFKPIPAESAASGNDAWTFAAYAQSAAAAEVSRPYPRPGSWQLVRMESTDRKDIYWQWIPWTATLGANATTAVALCIGYRELGAKAGQPLTSAWRLTTPIGLSGIAYRSTTSTLTMGPGSPPQEGRLEVRATLSDGTAILARTIENEAATNHTDTFDLPALEVEFRVHPWDPTNTSYNLAANVGALQPTDDNGFEVINVVATFASTERIVRVAGARENIYQFGRADAPAVLTVADADSNEEALYLYGVVVAIDDTLTIDADRMTIEDGAGLGFGNQWGGQIPAVPAGAFTVTVEDNAIGEFELGVTYSKAWN